MFDYSLSNGDRHSNNILVLSPTKLLAIDEAMKLREPLMWCPTVRSQSQEGNIAINCRHSHKSTASREDSLSYYS